MRVSASDACFAGVYESFQELDCFSSVFQNNCAGVRTCIRNRMPRTTTQGRRHATRRAAKRMREISYRHLPLTVHRASKIGLVRF